VCELPRPKEAELPASYHRLLSTGPQALLAVPAMLPGDGALVLGHRPGPRLGRFENLFKLNIHLKPEWRGPLEAFDKTL
jgi:hypothetical protein